MQSSYEPLHPRLKRPMLYKPPTRENRNVRLLVPGSHPMPPPKDHAVFVYYTVNTDVQPEKGLHSHSVLKQSHSKLHKYDANVTQSGSRAESEWFSSCRHESLSEEDMMNGHPEYANDFSISSLMQPQDKQQFTESSSHSLDPSQTRSDSLNRLNATMDHHDFKVPDHVRYVYVECMDQQGRYPLQDGMYACEQDSDSPNEIATFDPSSGCSIEDQEILTASSFEEVQTIASCHDDPIETSGSCQLGHDPHCAESVLLREDKDVQCDPANACFESSTHAYCQQCGYLKAQASLNEEQLAEWEELKRSHMQLVQDYQQLTESHDHLVHKLVSMENQNKLLRHFLQLENDESVKAETGRWEIAKEQCEKSIQCFRDVVKNGQVIMKSMVDSIHQIQRASDTLQGVGKIFAIEE